MGWPIILNINSCFDSKKRREGRIREITSTFCSGMTLCVFCFFMSIIKSALDNTKLKMKAGDGTSRMTRLMQCFKFYSLVN